MKKIFLIALVLLCSVSVGFGGQREVTIEECEACIKKCERYFDVHCSDEQIGLEGAIKGQCTEPNYKEYEACFNKCISMQ